MAVFRLLSAIFLLVLQARSKMVLGYKEKDFFTACPPSKCGQGGPEIRYPFRLQSSPSYCGVRGLALSCSGNDTFLSLQESVSHKVIAIDYHSALIIIKLGDPWANCPLQNLSSTRFIEFTWPFCASYGIFTLVNCSNKWDECSQFSGPFNWCSMISCLSNADHFVYVADAYGPASYLPSDCVVVSNMLDIPHVEDLGGRMRGVDDYVERGELNLLWCPPWFDSNPQECRICPECEVAGGRCEFNPTTNQTFCVHPGSGSWKIKLITGTSLSGVVVLVSVASIIVYILKKSDREKETRLKVERFLATYKAAKPMRYSFAEVKKMTRHFKHKLGEGGFGTVYKGELPNGIPVAVKMLTKSKGEGAEFINEVATVGRIHHVNVVRLLGFCSEGTWRALIYEFMPNESLEKFIFSKENKTGHRSLDMKKLQEIAIGIAQGIEYLHQGCLQRILHFDIKPHNILLDHNFNPKISDFGLAKLCARDQSIITMTAARGTMGYIAPEIYCRNFGAVSYKSDVYSFGMLVLEMVGGRKNIDPEIEKESQIYFPEWIYHQIVQGHDLGLVMEKSGIEEDIVKKLAIVALWCIQWNPMDRPSMTRVVQMLMENLESLQIPPAPIVSSTA